MRNRFEKFTVYSNQINRNIRIIEDNMMKEQDLRNTHVSCLYFIYIKRNVTLDLLCKLCGQQRPAVTKAVLHLKNNGYISFDVEDENRRKDYIVLTPKGKEAAKKVTADINNILGQIDEDLSEEELAEFYRCLGIIRDKISNYAKNMK